MAREVVVPQPSRDELGDAHNDPPLDRVTLAARQPDPAWTQQVPPGPDGRQRHLSAVWDMVLESRGVHGTLRISFPCPIVVRGGANLPAGQELVGMFAYQLASGHWRVRTGVARNGEAGTVTTPGVFGLNVLTGWEHRRVEWVDVAWLAMRVHVGRQRKMGVADVIDVEEDEPPPTRKRKGRPEGDTPPAPPKPRVQPPRRSGQCGQSRRGRWGGGQRGVVQEWVDQQRAGAWEAGAISAEAANRNLEARLSRAKEDRRDCESRLAGVTKERDRLATKVKTLERDVATLRKAKPAAQPAAQPAEAVERAEGAEAPAPPGDKGGASAAGVRYLLAGAQAWHAQAEACAGQMSAVSTGLRMAMMASGQQVSVDSVPPDAPKVTAAMEDVRLQYPPHRLTSAAMDLSFVEVVGEHSSQGSASRSSAPGGPGA